MQSKRASLLPLISSFLLLSVSKTTECTIKMGDFINTISKRLYLFLIQLDLLEKNSKLFRGSVHFPQILEI